MRSVLLIDDQPDILQAMLQHVLREGDVELIVARDAASGVDLARARLPDVVLLDVHLPDKDGLDVFESLREIDARMLVIFITVAAETDLTIEAMKRGAYEYLLKPIRLDNLRQVLESALEIRRLMNTPAMPAEQPDLSERADLIIGRCTAMREVYKAIGRVAAQDVTVLITGESGTGKELVARAIYQHSRRATKPFMTINCAAIPEALLESELFGHEKGAYTGADRQRVGKFEQCSGGTLFLDEVGDMPVPLQAKVLRLLQEQRFERVGGNVSIQTDVRLIAATNHRLESLVAQGRFRNDLLFRLNVFTIHLPPLRERGDDISLLIQYAVRRANQELGRDVQTINPDAMASLLAYLWPGNVRELQSVIKQALLRTVGHVLLPDFLPPQVREPGTAASAVLPPSVEKRTPSAFEPTSGEPRTSDARAEGPLAEDLSAFVRERIASQTNDLYHEAVARLERRLLPMVLAATEGNQVQAARLLGISRTSLRQKLRDLGIVIYRTIDTESPDE